jgi:Putative prokaryotic signal transducing protein
MKRVFSSPDNAGVGLAQSILDAAGITCEVRNDAVSQSVPGAPFNQELWVLRDADYEEARRLVRSVGAPDSAKPE